MLRDLAGFLVKYDDTGQIFTDPGDKRTEDHMTRCFVQNAWLQSEIDDTPGLSLGYL